MWCVWQGRVWHQIIQICLVSGCIGNRRMSTNSDTCTCTCRLMFAIDPFLKTNNLHVRVYMFVCTCLYAWNVPEFLEWKRFKSFMAWKNLITSDETLNFRDFWLLAFCKNFCHENHLHFVPFAKLSGSTVILQTYTSTCCMPQSHKLVLHGTVKPRNSYKTLIYM